MQINCLIVDDEPLAIQLLQQYIEAVPYLKLAGKCHSGVEALSILHQQKIDLIFLDINMPRLTGIELAKTLSGDQKIIFTTAYSEYAVESYELNAVDYLLKPITFDRFIKALNKAVGFFKISEEEQSIVVPGQQEQYVFVRSGKAIIQLYFKNILYVEGLKDYVRFYTTEGNHVVYKRMKELETILPENFLRVHNSFIINQQRIKKIEDHHVLIENEKIPVSEKYRDGFYAAINKHSI